MTEWLSLSHNRKESENTYTHTYVELEGAEKERRGEKLWKIKRNSILYLPLPSNDSPS